MAYIVTKKLYKNDIVVKYMLRSTESNAVITVPKVDMQSIVRAGLVINAKIDRLGRILVSAKTIKSEKQNLGATKLQLADKRVAFYNELYQNGHKKSPSNRAMKFIDYFRSRLSSRFPTLRFGFGTVYNRDYSETGTAEDIFIFCQDTQSDTREAAILTLCYHDDFACGASDSVIQSTLDNFQNVDFDSCYFNLAKALEIYFESRMGVMREAFFSN